jgi:hypothetical protein
MSLDLPPELVWVIQLLGLPWPTVEEDELRNHATQIRTFASSLADTHSTAHGHVQALAATYHSRSYELMAAEWSRFTSTHIDQLVPICNAIAEALDVTADLVVAAKWAIIGALGAMAGEFLADQAAAAATFGIAEAAIPALIEGTKLIVKGIIDQLEQQIIGQVLGAALTPLENMLEPLLQDALLQGAEAVLA